MTLGQILMLIGIFLCASYGVSVLKAIIHLTQSASSRTVVLNGIGVTLIFAGYFIS